MDGPLLPRLREGSPGGIPRELLRIPFASVAGGGVPTNLKIRTLPLAAAIGAGPADEAPL